MKTKYFFAYVKAINDQERTLDAIASTSDLDRDKDVILPSAFKESLDAFKANPVILACHQHRLQSGSSPVIGSALPESIKITDTEVPFTMRFATTALGEEYWQLYRDKHMRAFSIGFIPLEHEDKKDEELGWVRTYTKIELLEISAVPVPSNRRALVRAKGFFDDNDQLKDIVAETIKEILSDSLSDITKLIKTQTTFVEDQFDEIKSIIIADRDGLAEGLLGGKRPDEPSGPDGDDEKAAERIEVTIEAIRKHATC